MDFPLFLFYSELALCIPTCNLIWVYFYSCPATMICPMADSDHPIQIFVTLVPSIFQLKSILNDFLISFNYDYMLPYMVLYFISNYSFLSPLNSLYNPLMVSFITPLLCIFRKFSIRFQNRSRYYAFNGTWCNYFTIIINIYCTSCHVVCWMLRRCHLCSHVSLRNLSLLRNLVSFFYVFLFKMFSYMQ